MRRPKSTPRVMIEDLFYEMGPTLRADILASLHTIDRLRRKAEAKETAPSYQEQPQPVEERPTA